MTGWNSDLFDEAVRTWITTAVGDTAATEHPIEVDGDETTSMFVASGNPYSDLASVFTAGLHHLDNGTFSRETHGELRVEIMAAAELPFLRTLTDGIAGIVTQQFTQASTLTPQVLLRDVFSGDDITTPHGLVSVPYLHSGDPIIIDNDRVVFLHIIPITEAEFRFSQALSPVAFLTRIADSEEVNLFDLSRPSAVSDEEADAADQGHGFGNTIEDERGESIMIQTVGALMQDKGQIASFDNLPGVDGLVTLVLFADDWPIDDMMMAFSASMNRVVTGQETEDGLSIRREAVVHVHTQWRDGVVDGLAGLYRRMAHHEPVPDFDELVMNAFPRDMHGTAITTPHALVVSPQFYPFEPLDLPDRQIQIMQFIPITDEEFMYGTSQGVGALIVKLVESAVAIDRMDRDSCI